VNERVNAFAYYLPQFHPVSLNSATWGEGYTEWNAVVAAQRGLRANPRSQRTPGALGFYDLRSSEARSSQARLAEAAGLSAFCVYHYYSAGDRPMVEVESALLAEPLATRAFLCWANHDWTEAWKGNPTVVTWKQTYGSNCNDAHIEVLVDSFRRPNYWRLGGRPVFMVYDITTVPEPTVWTKRLRNAVNKAGLEDVILLSPNHRGITERPEEFGIDQWVQSPRPAVESLNVRRALNTLTSPVAAYRFLRFGDTQLDASTFDRALQMLHRANEIPLVVTGWSNIGRRSRRGWSIVDRTPESFFKALLTAIATAPSLAAGKLIAINAWNEWGELMTLEPTVEYGDAHLKACQTALARRDE
jgi:hypothetical protein